MISFIVIGRNIEFTAEKCIDSIYCFISQNSIKHHEIIYVDSDSTDNTVMLLKKYPIKILQIKGEVNAAIGRNVGAEHAIGNILFFVDGDMELVSDFFKIGFSWENELKYPFITGDFTDIVYDENNRFLFINDKIKETEAKFMSVVGGLFIIYKKEWDKAGGMDNRLIRHQDFDFGLRMAKIGTLNLRYPDLLAYHHTVSYYSKKRLYDFIFTFRLMSYGILLRKHITNKFFLKRFFQSRKSFILFSVCLSGFYFSWQIGLLLLFIYIIFQALKTVKRHSKNDSIVNIFLFYIIFDIATAISTPFYFPKEKKYYVNTIK